MNPDSKKDVIYVDIEDDITSIIEKVKTAKAPIVALVPPKRIGVLQSVVSLKLLQRAATSAKKRVVLITNDTALINLAAGVAMPVAKNLQSRPQLPAATAAAAAAATSTDEDVINGAELPVGELAKTADEPLDITGIPVTNEPGAAVAAPYAAKSAAARAPKKGTGIPDFDTFRKKLFIFGGLGALLIVFLVWAIFFAGKATVAITAKTNIVNINKPLQLREDAKLDATKGVAPAIVKEIKRTSSVDFTPTGKKDVGEKATGEVEFTKQSLSSTTVPAGTQLASISGMSYTTNQTVTIPASTTGPSCFPTACPGSVTVGVTAAGRGTSYNGATGTASGAPEGASANFTAPTSGGTDKTATVVSRADVDKAKERLESQDSNKLKAELKKQFGETAVVVNESFTVEPGEATSVPAVDQEATTAKVSAETTYRLLGVGRSDLRQIFDAFTKSQIAGEKNQKIYESGDEKVDFSEFKTSDNGYAVRAQATAQVGPNIDSKALAASVTGKRAGEIQQQIEVIQGVEDVNVKFSPFWVTKAPSKADKIIIKFVLKNDQN